MSRRHLSLLVIFLLIIVLGVLVWVFLIPKTAIAPDTSMPTDEDTSSTTTPRVVRADIYTCENGQEFQIQYDGNNTAYYTDSTMAGSSEALSLVSEVSGTILESAVVRVVLQDTSAMLTFKDMDLELICAQDTFSDTGIPRAQDPATESEATLFGDVVLSSGTSSSLPTGSQVTVRMVSTNVSGEEVVLAETSFAASTLPAQFRIPESEISMNGGVTPPMLTAEITSAAGEVLYKNTEEVSLMQETDALSIPVSAQ